MLSYRIVHVTCQLRRGHVQRDLVLFGGPDFKNWLADREEWRII